MLRLPEKAIRTHGKDNMGDELFIGEERLVNIKRIQLMPETEVIDLYARPEYKVKQVAHDEDKNELARFFSPHEAARMSHRK